MNPENAHIASRHSKLANRIQAELNELQERLNHYRTLDPEKLNWASVGDLQNLLRQLRQVNGKEWKG